MKTVSNTTPIISLSAVGKVELLRGLFGEVIIPQAVVEYEYTSFLAMQ